jgi:hypothetical protein
LINGFAGMFGSVLADVRSGAKAGLGLNKALFSDLPKHPKYKIILKLSQMPKSIVASVELNLR